MGFKIKKVIDKYGHFIEIKGTLNQEDITQYICTQSGSTKIYKLLTELQGETGKNIMIVRDLNTSLISL